MNINNYSTALFVTDIEVSKRFYCDVLGLTVEMDFGKNVIFTSGLTLWEIRNNHIIPSILGTDNLINPTVCRFELYFETEEIETVLNTLQNSTVEFLHEIHEEPWGQRTIRFFDPDLHLIEIGESMMQFVTRFYEQGLSVEQISTKTGIPENNVRKLINHE